MAGNEGWMRRRFREEGTATTQGTIACLSDLRKNRPVDEYSTCISALKAAAATQAAGLFALGPKSPNQLVWRRWPLEALPLEKELVWARHWLRGQGRKLTAFRHFALKMQRLVLTDDLPEAVEQLDDYVAASGWSLWAVELRCALAQLLGGTAAQREWIGVLQASTVDSIPGLLFQIFSDRSDDTFSYDAFYTKCMNSFPRFEQAAPWLVDYLQYRALGHINEAQKALPNVLARDITSSLVDYYESLIETLGYVVVEAELAPLRPVALSVVESLLSDSFHDHRLTKLAVALGGSSDRGSNAQPTEPELMLAAALYCQRVALPEPGSSGLVGNVVALLRRCQDEGAVAQDAVESLLKLGVTLRGLDFGPAIAVTGIQTAASKLDGTGLPLNAVLFSVLDRTEDVSAWSSAVGLARLEREVHQSNNLLAREALAIVAGQCDEPLTSPGILHTWAARQLLERQAYEALEGVLSYLRDAGPYWARQASKLELASLGRRGLLTDALAEISRWLLRDPKHVIELPVGDVFDERKWADFRSIDPVLVGLVAHHVHQSGGSPAIGYICKMACRAVLTSDTRGSVVGLYEAASPERRALLVAFLRDVWIEENLSLCHQFQSTESVRRERMEILQLLIHWDSNRNAEYAEAIKDLTFDQTLQRGLLRIDQTRVFVNESAITRWADAELLQDYERWKRFSETSSGGRIVDGMLRQYALDPANDLVLREFTHGRPTAADALLIDIIDRLFKRFLRDPTDGLDCYLSLRIRHGSLRGTVFGPLEEEGLLYSASGFSRDAFAARWDDALRLPAQERADVLASMESFSKQVRGLVDDLVNERVQIRTTEKPKGAFNHVLAPVAAKFLATGLAERPVSFYSFLSTCYFVFWKLIEYGLKDLSSYIATDFKDSLKTLFDGLIGELRTRHGARILPLVTTLRTVATTTQSQCDVVADWFRLPGQVNDEHYQLPDAIEIARASTHNVHRAFHADVRVTFSPVISVPLTTSALAVLTDCLFVVFENAWKHSGLGGLIGPLDLEATFEAGINLLTFVVRSDLSATRRDELLSGKLTELRAKYLGELPLELVSREGGSGFPKLARLARFVSPAECSTPFDFGIHEDRWYVRITVPLFAREGRFEAYE